MPYDLVIAYRIYPGIAKVPPVYSHDKYKLSKLCLESLRQSLVGLRVKVYAILDNCPPDYEALFLSSFASEDLELIILSKEEGGNKATFRKQIEILSKGPKSSHERRKKEIEKIVEDAEREFRMPLNKETYKLIGAAIYWAEGDKKQHFSVTNSDPFLIKFIVNWMHNILDIKFNDLKAHLNIYSQQNDKEIKKFWAELTNIPIENFGKSFVKPANKNYKKNTLYYGTIKVRACRGTNFRHRIFGWINVILKDTKSEIYTLERKWDKLKNDYKRP